MTHQCGHDSTGDSGPSTERTEQRAQFVRGKKERPRQNDARRNGTCQTRPERLANKHTNTVSMMALVVLSAKCCARELRV